MGVVIMQIVWDAFWLQAQPHLGHIQHYIIVELAKQIHLGVVLHVW